MRSNDSQQTRMAAIRLESDVGMMETAKTSFSRQRTGFAVAGSLLVDRLHPISHYPRNGELCSVLGDATLATGGAACNVTLDLARLAPELPVRVLGVIGTDENGAFILDQLSKQSNVDLSGVHRDGHTSYTLVMEDVSTKQRTFFSYQGANALFDENRIDWDRLDAKLLHVGYALILDRLDAPDEVYGTHMARLLHMAQAKGIRTSLDTVSEAGGRMARLLPPALRYTDYLIINEFEAQQITGVSLMDNGVILPERAGEALQKLKAMGVARWAVIHAPECCFGMGEDGEMIRQGTLQLPPGYIKGAVGAGDGFCAGVLLGAYRNFTLKRAMELGICAAACALSAPGGSEGLVAMQEALSLLEKYTIRQ